MAEDRRTQEGGGEGGGDRRFFAKPKFCQFCADKTLTIDYKKVDLLRKYVTEEGKIRPRRQTGACAKHQRIVAEAVKQSRFIALLPYTGKHWEESR
jgi:small subunit ribosomal protein S18